VKYGKRAEMRKKYKALQRLLRLIENRVVLVEGKRDKKALEELGCRRVITISGRVRRVCESLRQEAEPIVIATDLDESGNELARMIREELEGLSLSVDNETRVHLARVLRIKHFENAKRGFDGFIEEIREMDLEKTR